LTVVAEGVEDEESLAVLRLSMRMAAPARAPIRRATVW
jgi:hypothetical protein